MRPGRIPAGIPFPRKNDSVGQLLQRQGEALERIFDKIPVMVDIINPAGRVVFVNPYWESVIGWTQNEIVEGNLDVLAACYPDARDHRDVLCFIAAAEGKWKTFRHRIKGGKEMESSWIVLRLADGMAVGLGVDSSHQKLAREAFQDNPAILEGPLFALARASAYLRGMFTPPCSAIPGVTLTRVEPLGGDLRLYLSRREEKQSVTVDIPAVVVDLCAKHGTADLLVRMISNGAVQQGFHHARSPELDLQT